MKNFYKLLAFGGIGSTGGSTGGTTGGGVATGSYVAAEPFKFSQNRVRVKHNLGTVPTHLVLLTKAETSHTNFAGVPSYVYVDSSGAFSLQPSSTTSANLKVMIGANDKIDTRHTPTETDFQLFGAYTGLYSMQLHAGMEVQWFVW
jgi:hypothetical protein